MSETILVPHTEIEPSILRKVIESFITREGTDYGEMEFSMSDKVAHIMQQLEKKEVWIVFDSESESITIITAQDAKPLLRRQFNS
jgi:uncharacterized protein